MTKLDKNWPDGPWDEEPDRQEWTAAGFAACVVRHREMGHLCGYLRIPNSILNEAKELVDCTFEDSFPEDAKAEHVPKPTWWDPQQVAGETWAGFDCAHWQDLYPAMESTLSRMGVINFHYHAFHEVIGAVEKWADAARQHMPEEVGRRVGKKFFSDEYTYDFHEQLAADDRRWAREARGIYYGPLEEAASSGGASFSSYKIRHVLVIRTVDALTRH